MQCSQVKRHATRGRPQLLRKRELLVAPLLVTCGLAGVGVPGARAIPGTIVVVVGVVVGWVAFWRWIDECSWASPVVEKAESVFWWCTWT